MLKVWVVLKVMGLEDRVKFFWQTEMERMMRSINLMDQIMLWNLMWAI